MGTCGDNKNKHRIKNQSYPISDESQKNTNSINSFTIGKKSNNNRKGVEFNLKLEESEKLVNNKINNNNINKVDIKLNNEKQENKVNDNVVNNNIENLTGTNVKKENKIDHFEIALKGQEKEELTKKKRETEQDYDKNFQDNSKGESKLKNNNMNENLDKLSERRKGMKQNQDNQMLSKKKINLNNEAVLIKNEVFTENKIIPVKIINKVIKSICKITIKRTKVIATGTGFFFNFSKSLKFLITCYHVINPKLINEKTEIEVEIHNQKKMKLELKNRIIKYFERPKDITTIELKESDAIYRDIEFLDYDYNYRKGYSIYEEADIFTLEHPYGNDASFSSGKIISVYNFEFDHNISTDDGSSGCPILLLNNNVNFIGVIGIHKDGIYSENIKINRGTFIGEIFINELNPVNNNAILNKNRYKNDNYILAEIYVKEEDINKDIRILSSYEECIRNYPKDWVKDDANKNEEEIKKCMITINDELIPFNYFHKFKSSGKYSIKYSFNNKLIKTCLMFGECSSLTNIDLSNFNTDNIKDMSGMFGGCSSLINIDLSNFNTEKITKMSTVFYKCSSLVKIDLSNFKVNNVKDMSAMFYECSSLININFSNFNASNVKDMNGMFYGCSSLNNINLSNFSTNQLINMVGMFKGCSSLTNINLSNFNTNNVSSMNGLFYKCSSLNYINLSNFITDNVIDMSFMFSGCSSLTHINLSLFNTKNVTNMHKMFYGCSSLNNIDLYCFNTINVTDMSNMFCRCSSLTSISLCNFNTINVLDMSFMFYGCSSLTDIDISNFNISNTIYINSMFGGCKSLKKEDIIIIDENLFNYKEIFDENEEEKDKNKEEEKDLKEKCINF